MSQNKPATTTDQHTPLAAPILARATSVLMAAERDRATPDEVSARLVEAMRSYLDMGVTAVSTTSLDGKLAHEKGEALQRLARTAEEVSRVWTAVDWASEDSAARMTRILPQLHTMAVQRMVASRLCSATDASIRSERLVTAEYFQRLTWIASARLAMLQAASRRATSPTSQVMTLYASAFHLAGSHKSLTHPLLRWPLATRKETAPTAVRFRSDVEIGFKPDDALYSQILEAGRRAVQYSEAIDRGFDAVFDHLALGKTHMDSIRGFLEEATGLPKQKAAEEVVYALSHAQQMRLLHGAQQLASPTHTDLGASEPTPGRKEPVSTDFLMQATRLLPQTIEDLAATMRRESGDLDNVQAEWLRIEKQRQVAKKAEEPFSLKDEIIWTAGGASRKVPPLTAHAMCLSTMVAAGVPLGQVIAMIHDNPDLPLGPDERKYFARVCLAAAREYGNTLVSDIDPDIRDLRSEGDSRKRLRAVLRDTEMKVRRAAILDPSLTDEDLCQLAADAIRGSGTATTGDALATSEKNFLTSGNRATADLPASEISGGRNLVSRMVTRARAAQETFVLTAHIAADAEQAVPDQVVAAYDTLPHTRRVYNNPEVFGVDLCAVKAPTQKFLFDLLADTESMMARYRKLAKGEDVDVQPVRTIPGHFAPPATVEQIEIDRRNREKRFHEKEGPADNRMKERKKHSHRS